MTANIQIGNLPKLQREEQWDYWLEDLTGIMFLNGLDDHFNSTAVEGDTDTQRAEFFKKHESVRAIIHSALSMDIRQRMKHYGYNNKIHRGREIIDFARRSVKLMSGNMDTLYNNMWQDIRRTDFKSWSDFTMEFRRLYGKLKDSGQEVTQKSATIHLFGKVRPYLPMWVEVNRARYQEQPDIEKLLLELEDTGRQFEYDNVSLANLRANGDRNPKDYVSTSKTKGAENDRYRKDDMVQTDDSPQGQSQSQRQLSAGGNHHGRNKNDKNYRKEGTS